MNVIMNDSLGRDNMPKAGGNRRKTSKAPKLLKSCPHKKDEKSKYKKNPKAPKRFRRHSEIRDELAKAEDVEAKNTISVAKRVSQEWRELTPDQRDHWKQLARDDMVRFEKEKAQFQGSWKIPANASQKKDPSRPKKPVPAYFAFSNARRQNVKQQNPGSSNAEVSKILSKMWQESPDDVKQEYMDEETRQREIYVTKLEEWRKHKVTLPADEKMADEGSSSAGGTPLNKQGNSLPSHPARNDQLTIQAEQTHDILLGRPSETPLATSSQPGTLQSRLAPSNKETAQAPQASLPLSSNQSPQESAALLEQLLGLAAANNAQRSNSDLAVLSQLARLAGQPPPPPKQENALEEALSVLLRASNPGIAGLATPIASPLAPNPLETALTALLGQSLGTGQGLMGLLGGSGFPPAPPPSEDPQTALLRVLLAPSAAPQVSGLFPGAGALSHLAIPAAAVPQPNPTLNALELLSQAGLLSPQPAAPPAVPSQQVAPAAAPGTTQLEALLGAVMQQSQPQQQSQGSAETQSAESSQQKVSLTDSLGLQQQVSLAGSLGLQPPQQQVPQEAANLLALTNLLVSASQQGVGGDGGNQRS